MEAFEQHVFRGDEALSKLPHVAVGLAIEIGRVRGLAGELEGFAHGDGEVEQATKPAGQAAGRAHDTILPLAGRRHLARLLLFEAQPTSDTAGCAVDGQSGRSGRQRCRDGHPVIANYRR